MRKVTEGVVDVIVYPSAADKTKNRGFSFVEYKDHKAAMAYNLYDVPKTFKNNYLKNKAKFIKHKLHFELLKNIKVIVHKETEHDFLIFYKYKLNLFL